MTDTITLSATPIEIEVAYEIIDLEIAMKPLLAEIRELQEKLKTIRQKRYDMVILYESGVRFIYKRNIDGIVVYEDENKRLIDFEEVKTIQRKLNF
jgi:hypothetical protein